MSGTHSRSPGPKGTSFRYVRPSETADTHLAHWPPPRHQREAPSMHKVKHQSNDPVKRAKPRGWRLTRALFSEFSDDEE